MDIEKYLQLIDEKEKITNRLINLSLEITEMACKEREVIGKRIWDQFLEVFNQEELNWSDYQTQDYLGEYEECWKEFRYHLDITRYIVDRYADEFKGQGKVHRGAKYDITLRLDYDIVTEKFCINLVSSGLIVVFRDTILRSANSRMLKDVEKVFKDKSLSSEDLKSKFIEIKNVLDDWSGYYVTEKLSG